MVESRHLESLIGGDHGSGNMQVVFVDIEKYSKRKSTIQRGVVENFMDLSRQALVETSQDYISYIEKHSLNFTNDVIKIPTGDGLAVVFTFEGLQKIHLDFAEKLLSAIYELNQSDPCEKFEEQGWCNCHTNFKVRIGVHEGKGIVYKDINENYNVSGGTINTAERIMGLVDGMQIVFSEVAYNNLIDLTTDTDLESQFKLFENIQVKHGIKLNVYQYCPNDKEFINSSEPQKLMIDAKMQMYKESFMPQGLLNLSDTDTNSPEYGMLVEAFTDFAEKYKKLTERKK